MTLDFTSTPDARLKGWRLMTDLLGSVIEALASLWPRVHVPRVARATFVAVTPVDIASWSLGGFYFSLMPSVVRAATGTTIPIVGGLVVATLTVTGAVAVVALRKLVPEKMFILGIVTLAFGVLIT